MQLGELDPPLGWQVPKFYGFGAPLSAASQQQIINDVNKINSTLGTSIDPHTAVTAVQLLQADGPKISAAIGELQAGGGSAARGTYELASLVVAGAATVVNPVAGAVVGGLLAAGEGALSVLGVFNNPPTESCAWKFPPTPSGQQGICFGPNNVTGYSRPPGPIDPTTGLQHPRWLTLGVFTGLGLLTPVPGVDLTGYTFCLFSGMLSVTLGPPGTTAQTSNGCPGMPAIGISVKSPAGVIWNWNEDDPHWNPSASQHMVALDEINTGNPVLGDLRPLEMAASELVTLGDNGILAAWWIQNAHNTNHQPNLSDTWSMFPDLAVRAGLQAQGQPLPPQGPTDQYRSLLQFAKVYALAFQQALEFPLNGLQFIGGQPLANFLAKAWNSKYAGAPILQPGNPGNGCPAGKIATFDASGSPTGCMDGTIVTFTGMGATIYDSAGNPFGPFGFSLLDMAIAGFIDAWATQSTPPEEQPITLFVPPMSALFPSATQAAATAAAAAAGGAGGGAAAPARASPVVSGSLIAAGTVAAATAGTALATGSSMGAVLSNVLSGIASAIGGIRLPF
jgi:hypothetical protein